MTPQAIVLMAVAILVVWGGLVAAIVALRTLEEPEVELDSNGYVIDDPSIEAGLW